MGPLGVQRLPSKVAFTSAADVAKIVGQGSQWIPGNSALQQAISTLGSIWTKHHLRIQVRRSDRLPS